MHFTPSNQHQIATLAATSYLLFHNRWFGFPYPLRRIAMQPYERLIAYPYTYEISATVSWEELVRGGQRELISENTRDRYTLYSTSSSYIKLRDESVREEFSFTFHVENRTLLIRNETVGHVRPIYVEQYQNNFTIELTDYDGPKLHFEYIR